MATVEVMMNLAGFSPPSEGGGSDQATKNIDKNTDEQTKNSKGLLRTMGGAAKRLTGIQFSGAAMLKQSQIFTSTIGVIFQLMGALVDVILAPFIPILIPAIAGMAKMIPIVAKIAQWVADTLSNIFGWLKDLLDSPVQTIKDGLVYIGANIVGWIKEGLALSVDTKMGFFAMSFTKLVAYFPKLIPALLKIAGGALKGAGTLIMKLLKVYATPVWAFFKIIGKIIGNVLRRIIVTFKLLRRALNHQALFKALKNTLSNMLKVVWEKLAGVIGKIKIPGFGSLGKAIGGIAKASKAVPVLGSVATLGFGAYETYNAYKKTGSWKVASGYAAKTALATGLNLVPIPGFSALSLATDVGGSMALNKIHGGSYTTLKVETTGSDGVTTSTDHVVAADGEHDDGASNAVVVEQ